VNGDDPVDIAWGLKEAIRDRQRARTWGENGRKRVLKYFTWRETAKQTLDVYQGLLKKKP
jgi:glycosyltransferase involved in cell wall biosynthesis